MASRLPQLVLALGGAALLVAVVVFVVNSGDDGTSPRPHRPTATPTTTHKPKPKPKFSALTTRLPRALAVKIDNSPDARPQTGLSSADVIVVEPVEGGLTRIMALYWSHRPSKIGPVRSARETDIGFLQQIKTPVLAYSGSSPKLKSALAHADVDLANPSTAHGAFYRTGRRAPHNQYVNPHRLPATKRHRDPLISSAKPPSTGVREPAVHVGYQAASYDFRWSAGKWAVSVDGRPMESTESGRLTADTVVVQHVKNVRGLGIKDVAHNPSPKPPAKGRRRCCAAVRHTGRRGRVNTRAVRRSTARRTANGCR